MASLTMKSLFIIPLFFTTIYSIYPGEIVGPTYNDDQICIVGATLAGVHMANELRQQKGYQNIKIFERNNEPGEDQTNVENYRGANHELGSSQFLFNEYSQTVQNLLFRERPNSNPVLREVNEPNVWFNETVSMPLNTYIFQRVREYFHDQVSEQQLRSNLASQLRRFSTLRDSVVGPSDMYFGEPSWQTKMNLGTSFHDFLNRNNFQMLEVVFEFFLSASGYGDLSDIGAIYGLMAMTNSVISPLIQRFENNNQASSGYKVDISGLQSLLRSMISRNGLRVTYNARIMKIQRSNQIALSYTTNNGGSIQQETCDFLIWATKTRDLIEVLEKPTQFEYQNFLRSKRRGYMIKTLVDTMNAPRSESPVNFYVPVEENPGIHYNVDAYNLANSVSGNLYKLNIFSNGNDNSRATTSVYTQVTDDKHVTTSEAQQQLQGYLTRLGASSVIMRRTEINEFFPHYMYRDMKNGMFWTILKMQGQHKMWYIGNDVAFDSVAGVLEYNDLILGKMRNPLINNNINP